MRPIRQFAVLATVVLGITACNGGAPAASRPSEQPTLTSNLDQPSGDQRAEHRADEEAISQAGRQGAGQAE
jgi:hypothetical protein